MCLKRRFFASFILSSVAASSFASWDAANDFSLSGNPHGVWSYGWSSGLTGTMNLDTISHANLLGFSGVDQWTADIGGSGNPGVVRNGTNSNISYSSLIWKAHQMAQHPGPNGEYSIVRFTAPSTGQYDLSYGFIGQDVYGSSSDVHVLRNGVAIFNGAINGYGSTATGSLAGAFLHAGDTVDLRVGFGSNGNYFGDTTGSNLVVTAVPEPVGFAVFGLGVVGILGRRRRR